MLGVRRIGDSRGGRPGRRGRTPRSRDARRRRTRRPPTRLRRGLDPAGSPWGARVIQRTCSTVDAAPAQDVGQPRELVATAVEPPWMLGHRRRASSRMMFFALVAHGAPPRSTADPSRSRPGPGEALPSARRETLVPRRIERGKRRVDDPLTTKSGRWAELEQCVHARTARRPTARNVPKPARSQLSTITPQHRDDQLNCMATSHVRASTYSDDPPSSRNPTAVRSNSWKGSQMSTNWRWVSSQ